MTTSKTAPTTKKAADAKAAQAKKDQAKKAGSATSSKAEAAAALLVAGKPTTAKADTGFKRGAAGKKAPVNPANKAGATKAPSLAAVASLPGADAKSIYDFSVTQNGETIDLNTYRGRPVFIMNVASKCGKTEVGYKTATDLHNLYGKKGLAVIAFPCNQFGAQEPGTHAEICEFAAKKYKAKFPIMDKIDVNGDDAIPLYNFLKASTNNKRVEWNFVGFLCDKNGAVVQRFSAGPSYETVSKAVEKVL